MRPPTAPPSPGSAGDSSLLQGAGGLVEVGIPAGEGVVVARELDDDVARPRLPRHGFEGGAEADILVIEGYDGPQPVVSEPSPMPGTASE
jgi:hypothetical protein